jgi:peptidyl-prolyl cis-trans isomerase B (cyclophilin B)
MKRDRLSSLLFVLAVLACFTGSALAADSKPKTEKQAKPEAASTEKAGKPEAAGTEKPAKSEAAGDAAIKAIDAQIAAAKIDKKVAGWKTKLPKPTAVKFVTGHKYLWHMVTNKGTMVFEFRPDVAPMHVTNFIYLTRMGYFDGLRFHRVIKGFMAQGGDPLGTGTGGPGYEYAGEASPALKHDKPGVLSTANAGPNTDGSQFFIMFKAYPSLDMNYSIFGGLVEGQEVLNAFQAAANPGDGPPTEALTITKATVEVK